MLRVLQTALRVLRTLPEINLDLRVQQETNRGVPAALPVQTTGGLLQSDRNKSNII